MSGMPQRNADCSTSFTVALCTHNQEARLRRTLKALAELVPPASPWELLIVDNASTDGTAHLVTASEWRTPGMTIRTVRENELGLSNARNRAIEETASEYIIFIDDDETPDPNWLSAYERVILQTRPDALGGRIEVTFEDGNRPVWLQDELLGFLGRLDYGDAAFRLTRLDTPIFGGNFAFRREIFRRIGTFDTALGRKGAANTGGEDTEIYRRLIASACTVWWVPDAVIRHRIQVNKLRRGYFLDLHFSQGRTEGMLKRGRASRLPPAYLAPQLWRAAKNALAARVRHGSSVSLRKEMNVAYFLGYILGWACGPRTH